MKFDKIKNQILDLYTGIDPGHGKYHIMMCLENAKYGLKRWSQNKYNEDFIFLAVSMHDIGLIPFIAKYIVGDEIANNKEELRRIHNVVGYDIVIKFYNDDKKLKSVKLNRNTFKEICNYWSLKHDYPSKGIYYLAHAVEHHRASVDQTSDLDKFVRCCDGLNDHKTILTRAYFYNKDHFPDADKTEQMQKIKDHLTKKYLSGGYAEDLPMNWANDLYKKNCEDLRKALNSFEVSDAGYDKLVKYIKDTIKEFENNK